MINITTKLVMLSEAAEKRDKMLNQTIERLRQYAHRAMNIQGLRNDKFVLVCIKVDGPWRNIVDLLMPNTDWQPIRDSGLEPTAIGIASPYLCNLIVEKLPKITGVLLGKPRDGYVKCIVLDKSGCTVYEIELGEQS